MNLAVTFQQRGQRVLLIDLDAQGHASRWLGIDPRQTQPDASVLGTIRGRPLGEAAIATEEGVTVVPAHPDKADQPIRSGILAPLRGAKRMSMFYGGTVK
ncbi:MAG: ParA family protein [Chloroflexales bacterium]|nr:ParA family protein [Chloroflexales bacterium]